MKLSQACTRRFAIVALLNLIHILLGHMILDTLLGRHGLPRVEIQTVSIYRAGEPADEVDHARQSLHLRIDHPKVRSSLDVSCTR